MAGPLAGIRVVDVSQILSGPYACWRPGAAERLGLGEAELRAVNPELIYGAGAIAGLRAEGVIP